MKFILFIAIFGLIAFFVPLAITSYINQAFTINIVSEHRTLVMLATALWFIWIIYVSGNFVKYFR